MDPKSALGVPKPISRTGPNTSHRAVLNIIVVFNNKGALHFRRHILLALSLIADHTDTRWNIVVAHSTSLELLYL